MVKIYLKDYWMLQVNKNNDYVFLTSKHRDLRQITKKSTQRIGGGIGDIFLIIVLHYWWNGTIWIQLTIIFPWDILCVY